MRNFITLYITELRKIISKKSIWIMFVIGMMLFGTVELSNILFETYTYDGEVLSGAEFEALQRKKGEEITGRVMDDSFYTDVRNEIIQYKEENSEAAERNEDKDIEDYPWIWYCTDRTGNEWLFSKEIRSMGGLSNIYLFMEGTAEEIREAKKDYLVSEMNNAGLTEDEKNYWLEKYEKTEKDFKYSYAQGYLVFYESLMFMMSFALLVIIVGTAGVFADENINRTDVIILAAKKGRREICYAKILAGITFSVLMIVLIESLCLLIPLIAWGTAGWNTPIQNVLVDSAYDMTIGQTVVLTYGLSILAAMLFGTLSMFLSYMFRNTLPVMALQTSIIILGFINVPYRFGLLSKIWRLRPMGLLMAQGFADYRLFSLPSGYMNCYEIASIAYVVAIALLVALTINQYRRMQVKGR